MKSHFLISTAVGLVLATTAFATTALAQSPNSTNSQTGSQSQATGSSQAGQTDKSSGDERQKSSAGQSQRTGHEDQKSSTGAQSQRTGDEGQRSTGSQTQRSGEERGSTGSQTQRAGEERGSSSSQTHKTGDDDQKSSASQAQKNGNEGQKSSTGDQTQRAGDEGKGSSGNRNQRTRDESQKSSTGNQAEKTGSGSDTQKSSNSGTSNSGTSNAGTASSASQQPSARDTNSTQSSTNANASVNINDQQRTRVTQSITRMNVQPLTNVNFSLSVGTAVPRDVRLQTLPDEVVQIVPQYRGYSFVVVRDEIVIVEPSTYKIVSVLPRSGGSAAAAPARSRVSFTDKDRDVVRRHVKTRTTERQTTGTGSSVTFRRGERLPASVEIEEFPDTVYQEAPALREYRYIHRENRTYLVDPGERTVIEEID